MKFAAALIASTSAMDLMTAQDYKYMEFVTEQGRSYATVAEYNFRSEIFKANLALIEEHNAAGNTWTLGVHMFMDYTKEEMKKLNGWKSNSEAEAMEETFLNTTATPAAVDWTKVANVVSAVKNQGHCGSCWAFSTTGALEGMHGVATGKASNLAEQQIVDCSGFPNMGCNGGNTIFAFMYTKKHLIEEEASYPYTAESGLFKCKYDAKKGLYSNKGSSKVPKNDVAQMKAAIAKQPVSIAIEADKMAFQGYTGGVITGSACGTQMDHAVLAVGYGTLNGVEFALVKNSWTAKWGDNGFVRIGLESGAGVCGMNQSANYPTA